MEIESATGNETSPDGSSSSSLSVDLVVASSFQIIFGVVGLFGNFLCFMVLRRQAKENHTNWLIISQCMIDLLTSLILIVATIHLNWFARVPDQPGAGAVLYCRVWNSQVLIFCGFAISTFNLTVISVERYVAVVHPVLYMTRFKTRHVVYILAVISWLIAPTLQIMFAVTLFHYEDGRCIVDDLSRTVTALQGAGVFAFEFFLPSATMGFSFTKIAFKLRTLNSIGAGAPSAKETSSSRVDAVPMQTTSTNAEDGSRSVSPSRIKTRDTETDHSKPAAAGKMEDGRNLRRRNITITLLIVYVTYLVCWTPNQVAFLAYNLGWIPDYMGSTAHLTTRVLATLNICVNPIVYALRYNAFKKGLKDAVRRCFRPCS